MNSHKWVAVAAFAVVVLATFCTFSVSCTPNTTNSKYVFYFVKASWCGHCQKTEPIWNAFVASYKGPVELAILDEAETKNAELLNKYDIQGFPSFVLLNNKSGVFKKYEGERTASDWEAFLKIEAT